MSETFEERLIVGKFGETTLGRWLLGRHNLLAPVYEIVDGADKVPRVYYGSEALRAPDFICFGRVGSVFVEAKRKRSTTWYVKTGHWQTGIDLAHYLDYKRIQEVTNRPFWILFLHENPVPHARDLARGSPDVAPTGLFGCSLPMIPDHEFEGMVYWDVDKLHRFENYPAGEFDGR